MTVMQHTWTRKQVLEAEEDFRSMIVRFFGDVWKLPASGEYVGVSWDCKTPIAVYAGLWRLIQSAKHRGATRAAGKIEIRDLDTVLRFVIFYNPKEKDERR